MPITEVVDVTGRESPETCVRATLLPQLHLTRSVQVARVVRGKSRPVVKVIEVEVAEGEDVQELAEEVASRACALARADAGDNVRKYVISAFGQSVGRKAGAILASTPVLSLGGDEDDDDDGGRGRDDPKAINAAGRLIGDIGDRYTGLLDKSVAIIERLTPLASIAGEQNTATAAAEWQARVEMLRIEVADRASAREDLDSARTWDTIGGIVSANQKLLDAVAMLATAYAAKLIRDQAKPPKEKTKAKGDGQGA